MSAGLAQRLANCLPWESTTFLFEGIGKAAQRQPPTYAECLVPGTFVRERRGADERFGHREPRLGARHLRPVAAACVVRVDACGACASSTVTRTTHCNMRQGRNLSANCGV